ncbi:MAG: MBL fold metallo-hydrolase [Pseudomonadota bacterium]
MTTRTLVVGATGHVGYRIESEGKNVLMWGDVVHAAPIQLARPEVGLAFDVDPTAAAQTRARLLDMAATEGLAILGSHMPFPGFGHIERESTGYSFAHAHWGY